MCSWSDLVLFLLLFLGVECRERKLQGLLNIIQLSLSPFSAEFTSKTTFVSRFLVNLVGRRKITPKLNTGKERQEI